MAASVSLEHRALRGENLHDAGADGAEAQQTDANVVDGRHGRVFRVLSGGRV